MTEQNQENVSPEMQRLLARSQYLVSDLSAQLANKAQELANARMENAELRDLITHLQHTHKGASGTDNQDSVTPPNLREVGSGDETVTDHDVEVLAPAR